MENNSNFDKFVSILAAFVNDNEMRSEKTKEKFFGKSDIAILTLIGMLLTTTILMVALRFVVQPAYWCLVDLFSIVLLAVPAYFIVIRKLLKKK